jgi:signal transduction histidine kinase
MAFQAGSGKGLWSGALKRASALLLASTSLAGTALANDLGLRLSILTKEGSGPFIMDMSAPLGLLVIGLVILSTATAIFHIVGRQRWAKRLRLQDAEIGELQARLQRAEIFMSGDRHAVVAWGSASGEPEIEGDVGAIIGPGSPKRLLSFRTWLPSLDAKRLEQAVEQLKLKGEAFTVSFDGAGEKRFEIEGRAVTGRAVMRVREVSGDKLERMKADEKFGKLAGEMAALHAVLDAVPHQIWLRYPDGRLAWVNKAYADAVDCRHPNEAISKGVELIDRPLRERIAIANTEKPYRDRVAAIISGRRTMLEVVDVRSPFGSGGIGVDAAETEALRMTLEAEMATHVRTLNELPIAVAIFDRKQQLRFNNAAYQKLWSLDSEFLKSNPADGEILDRLRADRRLPEQVDFRVWKQGLLEGYQKNETVENLWHLPDGRMLRVVSNPTPDGGVSYVYDDMTERMTLEAQFKALSRVQNETLDSLKEGVAVFGSDGKLKLANAAFTAMWRLHAEALLDNPHIDELIQRCPSAAESQSWAIVRRVVTRLADAREGLASRDIRADNSVIDCVTSPLPDGATLVTFADVTANVNAEMFLKERNEALETADRVKNEFIKNVSYELRDPLQTVTMAAGMLADGTLGELNIRQKDYAETAKRSADALLALMNDIFDLASLDAGAIELAIEPVEPGEAIESVAAAVADQIAKAQVVLRQDVAEDVGIFDADPQRVRQILFHLVANAVGFSSPGQAIDLVARREADAMIFLVKDRGRGIPEDVRSRIFDRFESHTTGSSHRGVGLGLSMVKAFMELHHGTVELSSSQGEGTVVTCRFPLVGRAAAPLTTKSQKAA